LHWGQILVKNVSVSAPTPPNSRRQTTTKLPLDDIRHGVKATIIDLGLSRMDADMEKVYWTPIDDEVFEGEGDYQFEVYRIMRELNRGGWGKYNPSSNVAVSGY
jgi:serine/threonine-protein kinase haspin